eukprot:scaffold274053_cov28-Tisochrysis_lutea.AAC.2
MRAARDSSGPPCVAAMKPRERASAMRSSRAGSGASGSSRRSASVRKRMPYTCASKRLAKELIYEAHAMRCAQQPRPRPGQVPKRTAQLIRELWSIW